MQGKLRPVQQEECGMDRMVEGGITYLRRWVLLHVNLRTCSHRLPTLEEHYGFLR